MSSHETPTFNVNETLTADDANNWLQWHTVSKGDDTSRTSTQVTHDPELYTWLSAGQYLVVGMMSYIGPVGADFRWGFWTLPPGYCFSNTVNIYYGSNGSLYDHFSTAGQSDWAYTYGTGLNDRATVGIRGILYLSDSGTVYFNWGTRYAKTTATQLNTNSFLAYRKIADV